MTNTITLPVRFRLADDWRPVDPAGGAAEAAWWRRSVHIGRIRGEHHPHGAGRSGAGSLSDIADRALGSLVR